jgi:hypothetical protein
VRTEYAPDMLGLRPYQKVDPVVVYRYDPGVELLVSGVVIGRDAIRVGFAAPARPEDEVTSLTVRWPTRLSKAFTERDIVEALIRGFVDRR